MYVYEYIYIHEIRYSTIMLQWPHGAYSIGVYSEAGDYSRIYGTCKVSELPIKMWILELTTHALMCSIKFV